MANRIIPSSVALCDHAVDLQRGRCLCGRKILFGIYSSEGDGFSEIHDLWTDEVTSLSVEEVLAAQRRC